MSAPPRIFDWTAITRARTRAERIGADRFLVNEAAQGLAARLAPINRSFTRAIEIDSTGVAGDTLRPFAETWTKASQGPLEDLALGDASADLAVSLLSLHAANDLPGVLIQVRRALVPDGVFAAALFAGSTLCELRDAMTAAELEIHGGASPRIAPFADVRELGRLLQRSGFALPVADVERTTVWYRDFDQLVKDLRAHGETNALAQRSRKPVSRAMRSLAEDHYRRQNADENGRLKATFDIVYLIGWAPDANQPRPLKPGTAKMSLAAALATKPHAKDQT